MINSHLGLFGRFLGGLFGVFPEKSPKNHLIIFFRTLCILEKVPEILVPSHFQTKDIDRTIQLVSRHLTGNYADAKTLLLTHPRLLFYEREHDDQHRTFGLLQSNWKMLTFDFKLEPTQIINQCANLLNLEHRSLKIRLYFLKDRRMLNLIFVSLDEHPKGLSKIEKLRQPVKLVLELDDANFAMSVGASPEEFSEYQANFFL